MRDVPIADPDPDDLGPCMLALTEQQRRFVIGWIENGETDAARVARAAGYSDSSEAAKVSAHRLLHSKKIDAAIHEESGRQLKRGSAGAIATLRRLLSSEDEKIALEAAKTILDRTGYGTTTKQEITVEKIDNTPTSVLLDQMRQWPEFKSLPVIEGEVVNETTE